MKPEFEIPQAAGGGDANFGRDTSKSSRHGFAISNVVLRQVAGTVFISFCFMQVLSVGISLAFRQGTTIALHLGKDTMISPSPSPPLPPSFFPLPLLSLPPFALTHARARSAREKNEPLCVGRWGRDAGGFLTMAHQQSGFLCTSIHT